jgi:hypothetical protein
MTKLPKHIKRNLRCNTYRDFKKLKRREWNWMMYAFKDSNFHIGCAFVDDEAYKKISKAYKLLNEADKILKKWWKKA